MRVRLLFVELGKLVIGGVIFIVGVLVGGMLATLLQLPPPAATETLDMNAAMRNMLLTSPLLALALALVSSALGGSLPIRAVVLSFLMWIAYTVNTQLEASIFTAFASGFWFSIVAFAVASLFCGTAIALLYPAVAEPAGVAARLRAFFRRQSARGWMRRLAVAAVAFMPIYWFFGMLVVPFTGEYYRENMYGLEMPSIDQILIVLLVRSLLFLVACLPVIVLWQRGAQDLFWRLGFALFVLVGLIYMLSADWMPVSVRLPHTIEILADEFVYAGVLVLLLFRRSAVTRATRSRVLSGVSEG